MRGHQQITVYFVGDTKDDALLSFPFDCYESAQSYSDDTGGLPIWSAFAYVDLKSMEVT